MATLTQKIVPNLWYDKEAVEAARFYTSICKDSRIISISTVTDTPAGDVDVVTFELFGQPFLAMSAGPDFKFTYAISFAIQCDTQEELDYYWEKLSSDGGKQVECGWLEDKYGLAWQIVPTVMNDMMEGNDPVALHRMNQAMMKMKKLDIAALERAYNGEDA